MTLKACAIDYFPPDRLQEIDAFALWAFGDDFRTLNGGIDFMNAWNTLHGTEFRLNQYGSMRNDMKYMIELWEKQCVIKQ